MLIDVRTYRCRPGTINKHLALYEEYGKDTVSLPWQPLAYLKGETGDPNEYVHIWVYEMQETEKPKDLNYMQMKNGSHIWKKVLI